MDDLNIAINKQRKAFFSLPKLIFVILGIILLAELIYAIRVLVSPAPALKPTNKIVIQSNAVNAGSISLAAPKKNYQVNEVVPVSVIVNTGGSTVDGIDLILHFNPKILEVTPAGLIKGRILDEYPAMNIDKSRGLISISGISSVKNGFKGTGVFAVINVRAKTAGRSSLTIDFQGPGITTGSNLVDAVTAKNILRQVNNLELNVQ